MTYDTFYSKDSSVYPGEYIPLPEAEAKLEKMLKKSGSSMSGSSVNMTKQTDCIMLEVAMPGSSREDIFIDGYDNLLSIHALPWFEENPGGKMQLHEIKNSECTGRNILLPENADTAFSSAFYKDGILSIYIPTTKEPLQLKNYRIIVY